MIPFRHACVLVGRHVLELQRLAGGSERTRPHRTAMVMCIDERRKGEQRLALRRAVGHALHGAFEHERVAKKRLALALGPGPHVLAVGVDHAVRGPFDRRQPAVMPVKSEQFDRLARIYDEELLGAQELDEIVKRFREGKLDIHMEHKGIEHRVTILPPGMHPVLVRAAVTDQNGLLTPRTASRAKAV